MILAVRHAMPTIEPAVPSHRWQLGAEGRAAARALRPSIPGPAHFVASDEPKAIQTLQEISGGSEVVTDRDFGEVRRPYAWSADDDYRALAHAYVRGVCHDGWEPHAEVVTRFAGAVARHAALAAKTGRILVIGTHGLALTVWLATRRTLLPSPADFWRGLRFPDLVEVSDPHAASAPRPGPARA